MSRTDITSSNIEKALTMFHGIDHRDSTLAIKYVNPDSFVNRNHRATTAFKGFRASSITCLRSHQRKSCERSRMVHTFSLIRKAMCLGERYSLISSVSKTG